MIKSIFQYNFVHDRLLQYNRIKITKKFIDAYN